MFSRCSFFHVVYHTAIFITGGLAQVQYDDLPRNASASIDPFRLRVPSSYIDDCITLVKHSKIPSETWESSQPGFGITHDWLVDAKERWLNGFDWRQEEDFINQIPNFKLTINDSTGPIDLHFAALFSKRGDAVPILFMHGWPGSFLEFLPMMRILADKYDPETLPYHIIVPSLPGYGLSSGPPLDRDFDGKDCARVLNELMIQLGFGNGYIAQGGDVGGFLVRLISVSYDACKAWHCNSLTASFDPPEGNLGLLTTEEHKHLDRVNNFFESGDAYLLEQSTRPATVSAVLASNPMALLAWVGEKFIEWADDREPIDLDTILTMASLYWYTDTVPRCFWPYRWFVSGGDNSSTTPGSKEKPVGYSYFPREMLGFVPKAWGPSVYPTMVRYDHEVGGHFAALEQPEAFTSDIEDFAQRQIHILRE